MSKARKSRIVRFDFERAVATETSPNETPIIFSNIGFYRHCAEQKNKIDKVSRFIFEEMVALARTAPEYTKPYKYRIRKSSLDFRSLALIHPSSQWRIAEFYRDYSGQICHFCNRSEFSIRSPSSVANTVFISKRRQAPPTTNLRLRESSDRFTFFAYSGYDRLYKFFNSHRLVMLESKYPTLMKLDIAKCFDSIYTHSITWATRNKEYAKDNAHIRAFGNDFDTLMQKANYNETNGIPIGPEASRIFSEIIFQDIDVAVQGIILSKLNLSSPLHYEVVRYVDDIFIFSLSDDNAKSIYEIYVQELAKYNLHPNKAKTEILQRPFFTSKSQVIRDVNICINSFINAFLRPVKGEDYLDASEIFNRSHLIRNFVDAIKSSCIRNSVYYDEVVPYIISALNRRAAKLVASPKVVVRKNVENYFNACLALLEVSFFFYGVAPAVTSSYELCSTIIALHNFSARNYPQDLASIKQLVHEGCLRLFEGSWGQLRSEIDGFVFLEAINVALATCTHGPDFMIPADKLRIVLPALEKADYFQLMAVIFYCKDDSRYLVLKREAVLEVDRRLRDLRQVKHDAHLAHIFLDAVCCPYISSVKRIKWVLRLYKVAGKVAPSKSDLVKYVNNSPDRPWFIDWLETDLLAALARKKLHQAYA